MKKLSSKGMKVKVNIVKIWIGLKEGEINDANADDVILNIFDKPKSEKWLESEGVFGSSLDLERNEEAIEITTRLFKELENL